MSISIKFFAKHPYGKLLYNGVSLTEGTRMHTTKDLVSQNHTPGILCIGAFMADVMSHVPALPGRGEGVVVEKTIAQLGGCAFNSGNAVRQLGQKCLLFAPIGCGVWANFIREQLSLRGLSGLEVQTSLDCGSCLCLVEPDGERTMITTPGIERRFEASWFDLIDAADYDLAFASGYEIDGEGGLAIIEFIERNPHIEFWYAPGPRTTYVSDEKMERIKALHPCWHLNDLELLQYAEKTGLPLTDGSQPKDFDTIFGRVRCAASVLATLSENVVVVTMGPEGAAAFFPDGKHVLVPTEPVEPIDTVGAGDTHLGALVAARHAGKPWEEALSIANRMAAAVCMQAGGTMPDEAFDQLGIEL